MRKFLGQPEDETTFQEHLLTGFIITSTALVLGVSVLSIVYMVTNLFKLIAGG